MQLEAPVSRNDANVTRMLQGVTMSHIQVPDEPVRAPVIQAPERPAAERPTFNPPHPPSDIRLAGWWIGAMGWLNSFTLPRVLFDWLWYALAYPARKYIRARDLVRVLRSGRVDAATKQARDSACEACSDNHKRVVVERGMEPYAVSYCGLCGCPESRLSKLENKNWYAGWHCPRRKHPGPYPDDAYRHLIPVEQLTKSCKGCGGGKH